MLRKQQADYEALVAEAVGRITLETIEQQIDHVLKIFKLK